MITLRENPRLLLVYPNLNMKIKKHLVVTIDYVVKNNEGTVVDSRQETGPLVYLHGVHNIIPGLESELDGKSVGDKFSAIIEPEKAYGHHDENMIQYVQRDLIGDPDITVGNVYHARDEEDRPFTVKVVEMDDDTVTLDGNHELAGVRLHFDVSIVDLREATEAEITHGHVHGEGEHVH